MGSGEVLIYPPSVVAHDESMETTTNTPETTPTPTPRLERPRDSRVLGGVAAGLAERTGISVGLIRLGFVLTSFFGGVGVVLYLAGWSLMPSSDRETTPAQRWLDDLSTPGRRTGAVLIGLAALVLLTPVAPAAVVAAAVLLVVGMTLNRTTTNT